MPNLIVYVSVENIDTGEEYGSSSCQCECDKDQIVGAARIAAELACDSQYDDLKEILEAHK